MYAIFLALFTWLWYSVRRQDTEEYGTLTKRYLTGMVLSIVVIGSSIFMPAAARLIVWALFILAWTLGALVIERGSPVEIGLSVTDSLVERFGLFTIIVLGEVVVGVVTGMSEVTRDALTVLTGLLGLMIGFGLWWTYFDFVGRRRPRSGWSGVTMWMMSHLPVAASIAASGAALVTLVEHAGDRRAPADAAWVLTGSMAIGLLGLIAVASRLADWGRLRAIYRPLSVALVIAAVATLAVGWLRPTPWLLVLLVVVIMVAVWLTAVVNWLRLDDPDAALPHAEMTVL